MQNLFYPLRRLTRPGWPASLIGRAMRITLFLTLASVVNLYATGYSQEAKLSFVLKDVKLSQVFTIIQQQTDYQFLYNDEDVQRAPLVSIAVRQATVPEILRTCFKDYPLSYRIVNKTVVVLPGLVQHTGFAVPVPVVVQQQFQFTVTGSVKDQQGNPLVGVSVGLKGSQTGTVTDASGRYSLTLEDGSGTLVFSYVGYSTLEAPVNGRSEINVTLEPSVSALEQVVVVGYGTEKKENMVGAAGVASGKDFGDIASSSTTQLLQGKISGVQVVNNSGDPGSGVNIVIRGTGSFTDVSPLYVIDGIQSDQQTFNSLSPFDIQKITVLKDASSVAIYGAQGANGVVIVTTKHPTNGAPKVTYNGYIGFSRPWKQFDIMNAEQYTDFVKDWYQNDGLPLPPRVASPYALVTRTDWQKEMFQTGKVSSHYINVGGGSDHVNYSFSLGYTKQEGNIIGADYQRINSRIRLEEHVGSRITLGQQLNTWYSIHSGTSANILNGLRMPPYLPIYDSTNLLGGYAIATSAQDGNDTRNPLIDPNLHDIKDRDFNTYFQIYGELQILKGLTFRSQLGGRVGFSHFSDYNPTYASNQLVTQDQIDVDYNYGMRYVFENYFSYNNTWGKHTLGLTLGNSYRDGGIASDVSLVGSDFANDEIHQIGVAKTRSVGLATANSQARFISYYARINYTYNEKYILTLTGRRDATSLFSDSNRVGYFPAAGIGWRISQEPFMKSVSFISDLKLRASVGKTGNSNIEGFSYQSNVWTGGANSVVYPLGPDETLINGATVAIPATPNLQWETTVQTDIGLDASLFRDRLTVSADYYKRNNRDLLVNVPVALSTGYGGLDGASSSQLINAASAYNSGFELALGFRGTAGEVTYGVSVNGAYNKNEVTSLGTQGAVPIISGSFYDVSSMTRTEKDHPIGAFYGYVYDHVAIDQADVDKYNKMAADKTGDPNAEYQAGLLPGDRIFKDINHDGQVTEADKTFLGSPIPRWTYGGSINLAYKNFDFMASFEGVADVQLINAMKFYMEGEPLPFNGKTAVLKRWQKPGDVTDIARAGQHFSTSANLRASSWYVENGDYLRVRNVSLGYTIPPESLKSLTHSTITNLRVYLTAQNLFTFTNYSGYDPEIGTGNFIFSRGIDRGATPQARTLIFGVQVGF